MAVFSQSNLDVIYACTELCTVFQTKVIKRTMHSLHQKNVGNSVALAIVSAILLGHSFNKRVDI